MEDKNKDINDLEKKGEAYLAVLKKANKKVRFTLLFNILGMLVLLAGINIALIFKEPEATGVMFYVTGLVSVVITGYLWWFASKHKDAALQLLKDFETHGEVTPDASSNADTSKDNTSNPDDTHEKKTDK